MMAAIIAMQSAGIVSGERASVLEREARVKTDADLEAIEKARLKRERNKNRKITPHDP